MSHHFGEDIDERRDIVAQKIFEFFDRGVIQRVQKCAFVYEGGPKVILWCDDQCIAGFLSGQNSPVTLGCVNPYPIVFILT